METLESTVDEIRAQALGCLRHKFKMVRIPRGQKSPSDNAWNTPEELIGTEERLAECLSNGPINIGLCHEQSGTCAIDVDDEAWTRVVFEEFGLDYDAIMKAGLRIWSKENRDKVVFRAPPSLRLQRITWPLQFPDGNKKFFSVFELRAGPNQDVLPPSLHPDGHNYLWWPGKAPREVDEVPTIPDDLYAFWLAYADRDSGVREAVADLCPWKPAAAVKRPPHRARSASTEHGDVIGQFNRCNDVGSMLEQHGYKRKGKRYLAPSSSTVIPGVVILDDKCFSHHGSDPLADGYAHDAFDLLVTLGHGGDFAAAVKDAASQLGIDRRLSLPIDMQIDLAAAVAAQAARKAAPSPEGDIAQTSPVCDISAAAEQAAAAELDDAFASAEPVKKDPTLPKDLLHPPGIFAEVVDYMLRTAQYPQPELAVAATMTLFAVVLGTKVCNWSGLRTQLYHVVVAGTSAGKEHGRKCIDRIMTAAGMGGNIGGDKISSSAGLLRRLGECNNTLFMQDEFGPALKRWTGKNASAHVSEIVDVLLSAFSKADGVLRGSERGDSKMNPRVDIPFPCLSLYGTTPPSLWDALSGNDAASGLINRLLIIQAGEKPRAQRSALTAPPERVVAWVQAARAMGSGLQGRDHANPILLADSAAAENVYTHYLDDIDRRIRALEARGDHTLAQLWGRAAELAQKVGLIMACTRHSDPDDLKRTAEGGGLEVDGASAAWAVRYVDFCLSFTQSQVETRVGDSDFDRLVQDATRVVDNTSVKGRTIAELCRFCRSFRAQEPRVQDSIVDAMKRRGSVVTVRFVTAANRPRVSLVSTKWTLEIEKFGGVAVMSETNATKRDASVDAVIR